jgi:tetratricopeptide (TPR) repeat protein
MGVVYKARQRGLGRLVALKMLRLGESEADVQRFRNEAAMVAELDHPHIVPVHEVGEYRGQTYFSMRLVEGGSLADRLDAFRADPRAAARLVVAVARAVHHAHQRGVLHRDLKPANILLDQGSQPHVTDFGLAKRIEVDGSLTQSGMLVGTPSYMAPEQASGKKGAVTTATDVYGLGAVLYALLTGRPPLQGETILETLEQVKGQEPEPPGKSNPRVDRDLETVCLKCLNKDPHQRYGSAETLVEDLERWLKGEPIQARPLGLVARVWRWCRRYPVVASLTAAAALLLLTVVAGLSGGLIVLSAKEKELQDALDQAQGQERAAGRQQQRAEENLEVAYQVLDQIYLDLAENRLPRERQLGPEDRRLLEKALTFYQHFTRQNDTDPRVRERTAKAYLRVGAIQEKLGQSQVAGATYRKALALWDKLAAEFPGRPEYRLHLARCYGNLAGMRWQSREGFQERYSEITEAAEKALTLREELAKEFPGQVDYQRDLGLSHYQLGGIFFLARRYPQAEKAMPRAIAIREKLAQKNPDVMLYRQELGHSLGNLGDLLGETGRLREAEPVIRRYLALRQKVADDFPASPEARHYLADGYMTIAKLAYFTGKLHEARDSFLLELPLREKLTTEFPGVADYQSRLHKARINLAVVLAEMSQFKEAAQVYRQVVDDFPRYLKDRGDLTANRFSRGHHYAVLGGYLVQAGQPKDAEVAYGRALELVEKLVMEFPGERKYREELAACNADRSIALHDAGRAHEAEAACRRALDIQKRLATEFPKVPDTQHGLARTYSTLGGILWGAGRLREAQEAYGQALQLSEKLVTDFAAVPRYRETLSIGCHNLAYHLLLDPNPSLKALERATKLARRAVELAPQHLEGACLETLGMAHYRAGHWKAALTAYEKSIKLPKTDNCSAWFFLAMTRWQLGDKEQARQAYDRAIQALQSKPRGKPEEQELRGFRAEAAALLGLKDPPKPKAQEASPPKDKD